MPQKAVKWDRKMKLVHKQELYCYLHKCLDNELLNFLKQFLNFIYIYIYIYIYMHMHGTAD